MKASFRIFLCSCLLSMATALAAADRVPLPQDVEATSAVRVTVPGSPTMTLDPAALVRTQVTASVHDEAPAEWEGVALADVLRNAGAPLDQRLRGRALSAFVRVTAVDGYRVVFSLAELDAAFGNTVVVLADRRDGKPLAGDGPYRLVVPGDKRAGRWLRNVVAIELVEDPDAKAGTPH